MPGKRKRAQAVEGSGQFASAESVRIGEIEVPAKLAKAAEQFGIPIQPIVNYVKGQEMRIARLEAAVNRIVPVMQKLDNILSNLPQGLPGSGSGANPDAPQGGIDLRALGDIARLLGLSEPSFTEKLTTALLMGTVQNTLLMQRAMLNSFIKGGILTERDIKEVSKMFGGSGEESE